MAERFGQVRERPGRGGVVRVYLDFGRHGKVYTHKGLQIETHAQARMLLDAIRSLVVSGVPKAQAVERFRPTASEVNRVGVFVVPWLARVEEQVATGERSASYLAELRRWTKDDGHIGAWWSRKSIHAINYTALDEWSRWLATERHLGTKTRYNVMAGLHALLAYLRRAERIAVIPPFPWPSLEEHSPRLLSADQQARVLDAIDPAKRGIYLALVLLGLRPSEARRLRIADYEAGEIGWLTIPHTKTRRVKRLPVPTLLAEWIAAHVATDAESRLSGRALFVPPAPRTGGIVPKAWSKTALGRCWLRACESAVVPTVGLYEGTKHSRATDLLRQGVPERLIQALLGHADLRSTRRYARLADAALVELLIPRSGSDVSPAIPAARKDRNDG